MTTKLPPIIPRPPLFRVLVRKTFGASSDPGADQSLSGAGWTLLPELRIGQRQLTGGYELIDIHPRALPEIGWASFRFVYGRFAGEQTGTPPDFRLWEVRIQMADRLGPDIEPDEPAPEDWTTVFWGHVQSCDDRVMPGSSQNMGCRVYSCVDGLARMAHWPMDRYGFSGNGTTAISECYGHPGYNYQMSTDGPVLGNRATDGSGSPIIYQRNGVDVTAHCWQGAYSAVTVGAAERCWTERQAIDNAIASARPAGEPLLELLGLGANNYDIVSPMPVSPGESVLSFLSRRTRRERGQGSVFLGFEDQGDHGPDSAIKVWLSCGPSFKTGRSYEYGSGTTVSITGADDAGLLWPTVDLIGDHTADDAGFELSDANAHLVDVVETLGEPIEVAVTLSYQDQVGGASGTDRTVSGTYVPVAPTGIYAAALQYSLAPRWDEAERNAFESIEPYRRAITGWDFVYQTHGIPRTWGGEVGDGFNGTKCHADYRCRGDGSIEVPPPGNATPGTAPCQVEMLGYVPFFEGYDYSSNPPTKTNNAPMFGQPNRRPIGIYLRVSDDATKDRWFLPFGELPATIGNKYYTSQASEWQPTVSVQADGFTLTSQYFSDQGLRLLGDKARESALGSRMLGAAFDVTRFAITLGLRLPHRARFASKANASGELTTVNGSLSDFRRRKRIEVPNLHLWLAHPGCIWDLDQNDIDPAHGWAPKRAAAGGTVGAPGVLRDDRARLAFYHTLASEWYLHPRRRARWTLNRCGLMGQAITQMDGSVTHQDFPGIGYMIGAINASGQAREVNTVVTAIDYDHQLQRTTWQTDYFDLEFSA